MYTLGYDSVALCMSLVMSWGERCIRVKGMKKYGKVWDAHVSKSPGRRCVRPFPGDILSRQIVHLRLVVCPLSSQ